VDKTQPKNVVSTYYGNSPKRSTLAGKFGTWMGVSAGIVGPGLFYPPMALDETNSNNLAFGTDRINLDAAQGTGGWPTKVTLPGITDRVSAIHYTNSSLIYAGTNTGEVYCLKKSGGSWTATAIHAAPLPVGAFITDLAAVPGSPNTVVVLMSGFGIGHVWRGVVPAAGVAAWTSRRTWPSIARRTAARVGFSSARGCRIAPSSTCGCTTPRVSCARPRTGAVSGNASSTCPPSPT
jgi:hypothetical protein